MRESPAGLRLKYVARLAVKTRQKSDYSAPARLKSTFLLKPEASRRFAHSESIRAKIALTVEI